MALLGGRRFRRRKKEVIFVEGYYIDHADAVVPGIDRADETFHIFGIDSPETDVQHNYGTLQISVLDKYSNNALLDLCTEQDPDDPGPRQYRVTDLQAIDVWANVKDEGNTRYVKSWIMTGWTPGMPVPSGDPNAKAAYSVTGNADLPREFEGLWITAKKVTSGGAATLGATPVEVPREDGIYAVHIKALDETGTDFEQERVIPGATMVTAAGSVNFAAIQAQLQELTTVTSAYIVYLQSGTGVYPTVFPDKLRQ